MIKKTVIILAALVYTSPTQAGEYGYANSANEMINALSKKPMRTRSFVPESRTRGVIIVFKEQGKVIEKTVQVPIEPLTNKESAGAVNLKIMFTSNSSSLLPESHPLLNELAIALKHAGLSDKSMYINGHTDADGSDAYNLNLSLERAAAVKEYLISMQQIDNERLIIQGFGESLPLVTIDTAANKGLNRRVEIVTSER